MNEPRKTHIVGHDDSTDMLAQMHHTWAQAIDEERVENLRFARSLLPRHKHSQSAQDQREKEIFEKPRKKKRK